ncbi:MFS transporter [Arcticibacter eurypsychrophilus]|uniref:MFS transporter n=1 Tax=Arcticibacter eurypsychrophilus TaxID=1434752 RepID=UPI00084D2BF1|nr:MFS transporter [Arcticibacter eurypsychrophilus]
MNQIISGKARLSFWQIINMNFGFLGLQYSFGLQQANMSPIYSYLGAKESALPYLWLAGPITGLILQPIIGAMSDSTYTRWGRRKPYFLIGAIFCSLCLFIMPHSSSVWMAASILWILDAANNITQEPYRAFASDKLDESQHPIGFLTQSAFTGLGQTLSYLTPTLLILIGVNKYAENSHHIPITTIIAFMIGAVISISSIIWTLYTTKENPLSVEEIAVIKQKKISIKSVFTEIFYALKNMPLAMKQMAPMMFFSWYAMFTYWIYIANCLSHSVYGAYPVNNFRLADLLAGQIGAFYNFIAFLSAFLLAFLARKWGSKTVHFICLLLAGLGLIALPLIHSATLVFIPVVFLGFCWASMMGNPYVILAKSIPANKAGIYMGIFNLFIVIPMLLQNLTMPLFYHSWLADSPTNAIQLAGIFLCLGSICTFFVKGRSKTIKLMIP